MATVVIEENSPKAKEVLEYLKTLPFATVIEEEQTDFLKAAEKCDAISVDEFFDELNDRIKGISS